MKTATHCIGALSLIIGISLSSALAERIDESVEITISSLPPVGSFRNLSGRVLNAAPDSVKILVYTHLDTWRIQPNRANAATPLSPDGSWEVDIASLPYGEYATELAIYAVPNTFIPPSSNETDESLEILQSAALAKLHIKRPSRFRFIEFSGYQWMVKQSYHHSVGPGPNYFSGKDKNVWVDEQGRLHLKITKERYRWYCAEIFSLQHFGHGTYIFRLDSPIDQLDKNVVLGIFTWEHRAVEHYNREIDIEFSRWGEDTAQNAQFVVQPWQKSQNRERFHMNLHPQNTLSTHIIVWTPTSLSFRSLQGRVASPLNTGKVFHEWTYTGEHVPTSGTATQMRFNLWLMEGRAPSDGKEVEVILEAFEFTPAAFDDND